MKNRSLEKLKNFIAYSIIISGLVMNSVGALSCILHFRRENFLISTLPTLLSFLLILIIFIACLIKPKWVTTFGDLAILLTTYISFPVILYTTQDLAFITYLGVQGTLYGLTAQGKLKNAFFALGSLLLDEFLMLVKTAGRFRIEYLENCFSTIAIAVAITYIFSFTVTYLITKYLYETLRDNENYKYEKFKKFTDSILK